MCKTKILIIDDDYELLTGLSIRLKATNYDVILAGDAIFALSNLRKTLPDLIILDIGLPGADGFFIMEQINESEIFRKIPLMILSACDEFINKPKALAMGAIAYIQKPFDNKELLAKIYEILHPKGESKNINGQLKL